MFLCLSVSVFNTFIDRRQGRGGERRGRGGHIFNVVRRPGLPGLYFWEASVRRLFLRCAVPLRRPLIGQTDGDESVGRKFDRSEPGVRQHRRKSDAGRHITVRHTHTHTHTVITHLTLIKLAGCGLITVQSQQSTLIISQ